MTASAPKHVRVQFAYRLRSAANMREHHFEKAERVAEQRALARMYMTGPLLTAGLTARFAAGRNASAPRLWGPVIVTFTRVGPKALDRDNLYYAFKGARDGVADAMGTRDDDPRITWLYAQEKGPYAVRIEVRPADAKELSCDDRNSGQ